MLIQITDTLKASKAYEGGGFSAQQAETAAGQQEATAQDLVANLDRMLGPRFDKLATELRAEFRAEIHATARDQLFKLMTFGVALAGLCLALSGFLLATLRIVP